MLSLRREPAKRSWRDPYLCAVQKGIVQILQLLLSHGADPNMTINGVSMLSLAMRSGRDRAADLLRAHGAVENPQRDEDAMSLDIAGDAEQESVLPDAPHYYSEYERERKYVPLQYSMYEKTRDDEFRIGSDREVMVDSWDHAFLGKKRKRKWSQTM